MDMKQISITYDHAVEKDILAEGEGLQFLKDVQEGIEKDGLNQNTALDHFIITASSIPRKVSNVMLGEMLKIVAFG